MSREAHKRYRTRQHAGARARVLADRLGVLAPVTPRVNAAGRPELREGEVYASPLASSVHTSWCPQVDDLWAAHPLRLLVIRAGEGGSRRECPVCSGSVLLGSGADPSEQRV